MAWPVRYNIVGLLTLGTMVNYIDRVNISVAAPDIMQATGWDKAQFGLVFSAFLVGYALLQYPGGKIADRWSARKILALSCLGFSLFTALTPLGQSAFLLLLFLRFCVGTCESASLPSLASFNARWVPRQEFGRAQTLSISGASLGQMIAYPTTVWIVERFSWEAVFYFNAALGLLWMVWWLAYSTDTPREHRAVSPEELREIESGLVPKAEHVEVSLWTILKTPSVFFLCLSYMLFGFIAWIFILWFPTYLVEARGFSRMHMGLVGMLPTGASFLGIVVGGIVSDRLLRRGLSARAARARFPGLCVVVSLPLLLLAVMVSSAALSVVLFISFYFILSLAVSGYWSIPLELNPRLVGAISGVMNTAGNAAGIFGPWTAGVIVARTGDWQLPFYLAATLGLFCGAIFFALVSTKPVRIPGMATEAIDSAASPGHVLRH
jgi:ACS family hexuronate transporter-like MFS transporter